MVTVSLEQHVMSCKELAALICREKDVHAGLWHLLVNFAPQATLMPFGENEMYASVVVPVVSVGIMRVTEPNPMTVDASVVNPRS